MELILALLLLAVFALLYTAVGQLAVVIERLECGTTRTPNPPLRRIGRHVGSLEFKGLSAA